MKYVLFVCFKKGPPGSNSQMYEFTLNIFSGYNCVGTDCQVWICMCERAITADNVVYVHECTNSCCCVSVLGLCSLFLGQAFLCQQGQTLPSTNELAAWDRASMSHSQSSRPSIILRLLPSQHTLHTSEMFSTLLEPTLSGKHIYKLELIVDIPLIYCLFYIKHFFKIL